MITKRKIELVRWLYLFRMIVSVKALALYFSGLQYPRTEELDARVLWISFRLRRLQVVEISYSNYHNIIYILYIVFSIYVINVFPDLF